MLQLSCAGLIAFSLLVLQFDTDLGTLRRQHSPWYTQQQFWWTTIPILITVGLATAAITLRVTSPNAVRPSVLSVLQPCFEFMSMQKRAADPSVP